MTMSTLPDAPHNPRERVVLGRLTPWGMVQLQWTGAEPESLDDPLVAEELGARWEDDELVTYNLPALSWDLDQRYNQYLEDSD
jgi:hypothetical protein